MILETVCVGPMQVNCYILGRAKKEGAIIIDPGDDEQKIRAVLKRLGMLPEIVINTHGHYDHIGCDDAFGVKVYAHRQEIPMLKDPRLNLSAFFSSPFSVKSEVVPLQDRERVAIAAVELEVMHTPGHSPGGICLRLLRPEEKIVFSGDTLFCQGIGRTDFAGADEGLLIRAIKERLLKLDDDTACYPGHGPPTTIGRERQGNPFLNP